MTWLIICVAWLLHMCDMTHSYVWHDSFLGVTWLIHMCDMTYSYVWYDSCPGVWKIQKKSCSHFTYFCGKSRKNYAHNKSCTYFYIFMGKKAKTCAWFLVAHTLTYFWKFWIIHICFIPLRRWFLLKSHASCAQFLHAHHVFKTCSYVGHDSFNCRICVIRMCDMCVRICFIVEYECASL